MLPLVLTLFLHILQEAKLLGVLEKCFHTSLFGAILNPVLINKTNRITQHTEKLNITYNWYCGTGLDLVGGVIN